MTHYTLHGYWRSSCSWRVRIALHFKGIPFENRSVHLVRDGGLQHSQDYRALNPMRQVPTLHDHEADVTLTQSLVILDYLEQAHPQPAMVPAEPLAALRVRELCELINAGIQPLQNLSVLQQIEQRFGADGPAKSDWAAHFIRRGFDALERQLAKTAGSYSFGDQVSHLDACLIPQVFGARRFGVDMEDYPIITRVETACNALEAFQKADAANQPDAVG